MIAVIRWFVESVRCQMSDAFFPLDLDVYVKRPCDKRQYILRETYCVAHNCMFSNLSFLELGVSEGETITTAQFEIPAADMMVARALSCRDKEEERRKGIKDLLNERFARTNQPLSL